MQSAVLGKHQDVARKQVYATSSDPSEIVAVGMKIIKWVKNSHKNIYGSCVHLDFFILAIFCGLFNKRR